MAVVLWSSGSLRVHRSRNTTAFRGALTVTASDTIVFPLSKIDDASARKVSDGTAVALTFSGSTVTVGTGPSTESVRFDVSGV